MIEGIAREKNPQREGTVITGSKWGLAVFGFIIVSNYAKN